MAQVTYDDSSIGALIGADRIRKRPASMLGSSGLAGARHGVTEIYGNSLDEISAGFGNRLDVTYYADGSVSIRDYGRGVPLGWNSSLKNWNWHNIYNELYSGGKYNDNQDKLSKADWNNFSEKDYNYLYSVGLNGLGAASTQYTSEFFIVKSYRNGKVTSREFRRGMPIVNGEPFDMFTAAQAEIEALSEDIQDTDEPNGTFIHWKPDDTVFDDVNIGGDWLYSVCKDIAGVAGIDLHFKDETSGKDIVVEAGTLADIVKAHAGSSLINDEDGNPLIFSTNKFSHGTTKVEGKSCIYVCKCDISFGLTKDNVKTSCYHNSVKMQSGVQYEAIDDAISQFLKDKVRVAGAKLDSRDYENSFAVVVSSYSNYASFRNQTKDAVDDLFIYSVIKDAMLEKLNTEYGKGNPDIVALVERVIQEAINRQTIAQYAKIVRENDKIKREKAPEKFVSCDAYEKKNYSQAELWITEGDSAKGSVKSARNKIFQAIYPIKGKGLNVAKASLEKILKNKEIREIFALLGTGMDITGKNGERTFNIDNLKFDKIIFATDADEDGYQIRVLLFLTFYKLAPELITSGHVYIAETPRFKITFSDGSYVYARNDEVRDEIMKENAGRITNIARYKGLGEVNADVLRETTVHPDTRTLIPVTCDLSNNVERDLIDALFGADKYKQRKSIITTVLGCELSDMLDDSALMIEDDNDLDEDEVDDLDA